MRQLGFPFESAFLLVLRRCWILSFSGMMDWLPGQLSRGFSSSRVLTSFYADDAGGGTAFQWVRAGGLEEGDGAEGAARVAAPGVCGTAGVDPPDAVPMTDQLFVGVAEEDDVDGFAELAGEGIGGFAFGQDEAGAVGGGGDLRAGPLDVVDHADGDPADVDDTGGVGEAVAGLHGVFVAADSQDGRDGLEVVENADAFQVAAVEDEVDAMQGLEDLVGQVATAAGGVGVGDEADFHAFRRPGLDGWAPQPVGLRCRANCNGFDGHLARCSGLPDERE